MKVKATLPVLWCRDLTAVGGGHEEIGSITVDIDVPDDADPFSISILKDLPSRLEDFFPFGRAQPLSIIIGPRKED